MSTSEKYCLECLKSLLRHENGGQHNTEVFICLLFNINGQFAVMQPKEFVVVVFSFTMLNGGVTLIQLTCVW